jgi:ribosomal protein S27AE
MFAGHVVSSARCAAPEDTPAGILATVTTRSRPCPRCGGPTEETVLSGIVSLKRRRSLWASGKVSALNGETCVKCGHTELYAANPGRLFSDLRGE